ncbi:MAG TPA: energy transducer TonB [Rhizomicrobium sp.]|nr:energy transducer TonB [Rhizomicrobium sp.]
MAEGRRAYGFGLSRDGHIAFVAAYIAVLVTISGFGVARFVSTTLPKLRLPFSAQQATTAHRPVAYRARPIRDPAFPSTLNIYPRVALLNRQQGTVLMRLLVLPSGEVGDVNLVKSSGYPQLDAAAMVEAGNWRYLPAVRNWAPVSAEIDVAVRFKLED